MGNEGPSINCEQENPKLFNGTKKLKSNRKFIVDQKAI